MIKTGFFQSPDPLPAPQKFTVRDIKNYLSENQISPEKFAQEVQLSHMTIRRWLKRRADQTLPEKYSSLLAPVLARDPQPKAPSSFTTESLPVEILMDEIEKSGREFKNTKQLGEDLKEKLKTARVDQIFLDHCKKLFELVKSPKTSVKSKAIAAGALIYFISPIDLIPDHIPVVGYLDDLAVLSVAVNSLTANEADAQERKRAGAKA